MSEEEVVKDGKPAEISLATGLNFRLYDFIKLLASVLSAALIMGAAVWKVGTYFQSLTNEIAGLRADIGSVKNDIELQKASSVTFETRLSKIEVDMKVKEAVRAAIKEQKLKEIESNAEPQKEVRKDL